MKPHDYEYLKAMVDHPAGRDAPGRRPQPGSEPTPIELMQDSRTFRIVEGIFAAVGIVAVLVVVIIVLNQVFQAVMSL